MFGAGSSFDYGAGGGLGGSIAGGLLQPSINSSGLGSQGAIGNSFNSILAGVTQNAQQGQSPFQQNQGKLSPGQIAANMNTYGPAGLLTSLGGGFLPKLIFPIAGLWSLIGGVKSFISMNNEAKSQVNSFDPSSLGYNQKITQYDQDMSQSIFTNDRSYYYGF